MCLAAHELEFPRWTPVNVKLLLPPRHSRGNSHVGLEGAVASGTETKAFQLSDGVGRSNGVLGRIPFVVVPGDTAIGIYATRSGHSSQPCFGGERRSDHDARVSELNSVNRQLPGTFPA